MERRSNMQRMGILMVEGIRTGVVSALVSSIVYASVILGGLLVMTAIAPASSELDKGSTILAILFFIGLYAIGAGIVPALIMGILGGAFIGLILSFWGGKVRPFFAGIIGLLVGIILVLVVDYWSWTYSIQNVSLLEFLFLNKADYLIPSILALPISFYVGWKTNNVRISGINLATER
jgi:hypothetical protein